MGIIRIDPFPLHELPFLQLSSFTPLLRIFPPSRDRPPFPLPKAFPYFEPSLPFTHPTASIVSRGAL